jgi:hypothetical protein
MIGAGEIRSSANPAPTSWCRRLIVLAALPITLVLRLPGSVSAQTVEVAPVGGYRFGNDLFELATNRPVDLDGAPVLGGLVNVPIGDGMSFEALYTHQHARVTTPGGAFTQPVQWHFVADQWLAGGCQEFGMGRARPFLTGLLGLTRYGAEGGNEVRFTVGAGGGVKLPVQRRLGLRLDSRVFTTFLDVDARAAACAPGVCLVNFNVRVVWQIEFSAAVYVVF